MAQIAVDQATRVPRNFRTVILAASAGNVIEWYDFYIFGSLATILSVKFFEKSHPVAALLSTIALFTAGFLVRPLGAFVFGWLGDRVGRKYTFIMTLVGMALGTGAIGMIPTFEQIGLAAAIILFCLRMLQGLCLGGSYGGAITYVAEHVSDERRGYYTGWLQTSPTLGIVLSLIVILRHAPTSVRPTSMPGPGASRSCSPSCWCSSRSTCEPTSRSRRSMPRSRPRA
jgi:MFS family permease